MALDRVDEHAQFFETCGRAEGVARPLRNAVENEAHRDELVARCSHALVNLQQLRRLLDKLLQRARVLLPLASLEQQLEPRGPAFRLRSYVINDLVEEGSHTKRIRSVPVV